jgi:hypothetical protein
MNKCIYITYRTKKYKKYKFCRLNKQVILDECKNCSNFILKRNKPIKKVSNKRITISKQTYEKVFERDKGCCRLTDENCNGELNAHHIIYRSEDKSKIDDVDNIIMLCNSHHRLVHSNKYLWQPILLNMIKGENK